MNDRRNADARAGDETGRAQADDETARESGESSGLFASDYSTAGARVKPESGLTIRPRRGDGLEHISVYLPEALARLLAEGAG